MSKEYACPTVRLILTAYTNHFGDVTATIDASEDYLALGAQAVTKIEIEYYDKRISLPPNALRDIGPVAMNSWEFRDEFNSRMAEPNLYLGVKCPVELPNGKAVHRVIQAIFSQNKLRRITFETPQSEHSLQYHATEY